MCLLQYDFFDAELNHCDVRRGERVWCALQCVDEGIFDCFYLCAGDEVGGGCD